MSKRIKGLEKDVFAVLIFLYSSNTFDTQYLWIFTITIKENNFSLENNLLT